MPGTQEHTSNKQGGRRPVPSRMPMVRRASIEDAAQAAACLSDLGYATEVGILTATLAKLGDSPFDAVFVAVDDSAHQVIGVLSLHLIPLFHVPGHLARLTAVVVRAGARRRGVGRQLVTAAESFAREAGCQRIEVTSGDHRPEAHAFYVHLGYSVDERRFLKYLAG